MALLFAAAAITLVAQPGRAADPTSIFYYESEPGNNFGHGTADHITSEEANFEAHTANMGGPGILIDSTSWMVAAAGPGGENLVPGTTYTNVRNAPHETAPWFDLDSQRLYGNCRDVDGEFTVHDVGYVGAWFSRLSLSFAVTCEGEPAMVQGELRFNTSAPAFDVVMLSPVVTRPIDLGYAPVGGQGSAQTFTLSNVGAGSVTVGTTSMSGTNASSFGVVNDTCAGVGSLAADASCSFDVRLAPTASGDLEARASIAVGTAVGTRQVDVEGIGQTATTTTIEGPTDWSWPPADITAIVSPSPTTTDGGSSIWYTFPDAHPSDGPVGGPEPMMADGSAPYQGTIPPGVHRVYAEFNRNGTGTWAPSRSETITVRVMRASSIALSSDRSPTNGDEPPVITASLRPNDFTYAGGELVLTDVTTDTVLARVDVGPGQQEIRIEPFLTAGDHVLRAEYDGYEGVQGSSAELTQTIRVNAGATIAPDKIYPYVDRYLDKLTVEAWRYHTVMVDITVDSVATTETVRTRSLPPETQDILWKWDGRDDAGQLVPAGKYKVNVTFSDGGNEPKVVSKTITVSRHQVKWRTRSVTLSGGKYKLSGKTQNGSISRARSNYSGGVKLSSGKGTASVSYAFPVASADVYGKLTYSVRGRSTNGHKGLIAIWNPDLGGYRYTGNYDAAKLVGPGFRWWKTSVPVNEDRVRSGKVRAIVAVAKGFGKWGPATFDVKSVKLTYEVGTLVKPSTSAISGEPPDDDDVPPPATGVVGQRASEIIGDQPLPVMRSRLSSRSRPADEDSRRVTPAADPIAATGPASFAFEAQRGDAARLTMPDYTFMTGDSWYGAVPWVEVSDGQNTWRLAASGPDGARLESGRTYLRAIAYASSDRPFFRLDSWGACSSSACSVMSADFTVHDVAYDTEGRFERLSLSFDLLCTAMTGELRFNTAAPSYAAIQQAPFCAPPTNRFPDTEVGENSSPFPRTITNVGSGPVSFGQAGLTGRDVGDFEIVTDTCSNQTLAESASCTLAARFTPSRRGDRNAMIGMSMDFGSGARMIGLYGYGVRATTTTITAPTATTWSPVTLEAQVSPNPAAGSTYGVNVHFEFPDSPGRNTYVRSDIDGHAVTEVSLPPGDHRVYAKFYESNDFQASQSDTVTVHVGDDVSTSIELTATPTTVVTTQRPTIIATLSPPGVTGGELRIESGETGELYGSLAVSPGDQTLTVTPLLGEPGRHVVSARYLAHDEYPYATAAIDVYVDDDADVAASVKVTPAVFYPFDDDFRDQTEVTIKRGERLSFEAQVIADAGGVVHYETSEPAGSSDVAFSWGGRVAGGSLAPAGYYTLRVKLTDGKPNTKIIERRIVLSHDWVEWTTRTATVHGKNYSLVGKTRDAVVSRSESAYAKGVRLKSKKGSATVGYAFPVGYAKLYRDMTFEVEGRSTNGHQAVASIWNPELGGYRDLTHYDAARVIGPGYAKWTTSASGAHRVRDGKARGVVSTWNGLGAPHNAVFDIRIVRLRYEVGAIQRITDWSVASGSRANLVADYLADAESGRKGRTVKWMAGKKLPRWISVRPDPSSRPKLADAHKVEPTTTAESPPTQESDVEPEATPAPEPTPELVEPTPTPAPDPTSTPTAEPTPVPGPTVEPEPTPVEPTPVEPEPTPKPTPEPTPKPKSTPEPTPTPAPTPKSTPEPTPTPAPTPKSTPQPTPEPEPTPSPDSVEAGEAG